MKINILYYTLLIMSFGCSSVNSGDEIASDFLNRLDKKEFFRVQHDYNLHKDKMNDKNQLYVEAYLNYVFREHQLSNEKIIKLIKKYNTELQDSIMYDLLAIKTVNHFQLYEYELAAESHKELLLNYAHLMDSTTIANRQNNQNEYESLKLVPKQALKKVNDSRIELKKDTLNLMNISIHFMTDKSDTLIDFVFDTGAEVNVIQKSVADNLGLKIIKGNLEILGSTGFKMNAEFALADSISIGEMMFYNVVYMVLPDDYLNVAPDLNYSIRGIIGTPVITMMEEIRFKKNEILIPKIPSKYTTRNFVMDFRSPIVLCMHNGDSLRFLFDTGARRTNLFKLFFDDHKSDILSNYEIQEIKLMGAGETKTEMGYIIDTLTLEIGEANCTLDSIKVHPELFSSIEEYLHGNIGQDFINNFEEMTISYKYSSILFK